jgi:YidC/Oxa1 family membrane protein insertase
MDDQQKRLFMALLMCAAVTLVWMTFFAPQPPQRRPPVVAEGSGSGEVAAIVTEIPEGTGLPVEGTAEGTGRMGWQAAMGAIGDGDTADSMRPTAMPTVELLPPQWITEDTFRVGFTNSGARLVAHEILSPEQYVPRDDFGGIFPDGPAQRLSFAVLIDGYDPLRPDSPYGLVEDESVVAGEVEEGAEPEYERLVYRWSDGALEIDKIFTSDPERDYVLDFDIVIRNISGAPQSIGTVAVELWADDSQGEAGGVFNPIANTIEAACYINDSTETEALSGIEGQIFRGGAHWAAVADRYFMTAVAVDSDGVAAGCRFGTDESLMSSALLFDGFTLEPGADHRFELLAFTGPKDEDAMTTAHPTLSRAVNYGWFGFLAGPMKWILQFFFGLIPNWGVAIILLTILIKGLMFPFTQKTFKSMERMKQIQPLIVEVREKYKNDRTKMTEATMKLYKEHNVNPFGCLPMLLQMPIYIALYRMIYSSVELYKADFVLWITDLSQSDPYYILPVLMAITMFGQQLLTPMTMDNPQMKWVMRLMPLMFGFFMLVLPSGLVLYIFTSSLLGILQQYVIRRQMATLREDHEIKQSDSQTRQQRRKEERKKRKGD